MVTAEALRARIDTLRRLKEQHIANANACNGGISECEHWLTVLEKPVELKVVENTADG